MPDTYFALMPPRFLIFRRLILRRRFCATRAAPPPFTPLMPRFRFSPPMLRFQRVAAEAERRHFASAAASFRRLFFRHEMLSPPLAAAA